MHHIVITLPDVQSIHFPNGNAGPQPKEFEMAGISKMLVIEVIQPVQTEWKAPIVFLTPKEGSLQFYVDYPKHKTVITFSGLTTDTRYYRTEIKEEIELKPHLSLIMA